MFSKFASQLQVGGSNPAMCVLSVLQGFRVDITVKLL